ncbi:hypothetical protein SDC9_146736 [bioreactor metagenome]|uniref:Uncharacterized protein n=1 Tax=bioreactor metagenome TaxID=1076179 RepID=A0A645EBX1_9ZZZZ
MGIIFTVRIAEIQLVIKIITEVEVIMFTSGNRIIITYRTPARRVGNIVDIANLVITIAETKFAYLRIKGMTLLTVIAKGRFDVVFPLAFGYDIDHTTRCFRTIQNGTAATHDFHPFNQIRRDILQIISAVLIQRDPIYQDQGTFFHTTDNNFAVHRTLRSSLCALRLKIQPSAKLECLLNISTACSHQFIMRQNLDSCSRIQIMCLDS